MSSEAYCILFHQMIDHCSLVNNINPFVRSYDTYLYYYIEPSYVYTNRYIHHYTHIIIFTTRCPTATYTMTIYTRTTRLCHRTTISRQVLCLRGWWDGGNSGVWHSTTGV
jgi:hypothetical protein